MKLTKASTGISTTTFAVGLIIAIVGSTIISTAVSAYIHATPVPVLSTIPEEGRHFIIPTDCNIVIITGEPSRTDKIWSQQSGHGNVYKIQDTLMPIFKNVTWTAYLVYDKDVIILYVKD